MKDGEDLTASSEVPHLWVWACKVAMQMEPVAVMLNQKGYVARCEPIGAVAHKQTEVVPLDVLDQHLRTRFGKGRRQIHHQSSPLLKGEQVIKYA
jgi:hypothetical protein